jgi:anti-sigma-K factor RskA
VRAGRPDRTIGGHTRNHGPADAVPPIDPDDSQRKHRVDDERLADYLAGELSPDEQAAVEAQLAGDAALRRRLARMREADEALASLSSPAPRDGFEQRLQAALQPELERATAPSSQGEEATGDELAARRARRGRGLKSWPVALGGAAAAVALLAVVGIGVSQLAPGDDDAEVALDAEEAPESFEADGAPEDGPVLLASDRDLGDEELEALFDDPRLAGLADRGLPPDEGARLAEAFRAHFADDETMRMSATASADTPRAETMDDAEVQADRETDVDDAASPGRPRRRRPGRHAPLPGHPARRGGRHGPGVRGGRHLPGRGGHPVRADRPRRRRAALRAHRAVGARARRLPGAHLPAPRPLSPRREPAPVT